MPVSKQTVSKQTVSKQTVSKQTVSKQTVKTVTAAGWVLDVLGVPYGGPYGGRDAEGEYFTPESDLWLERIPRRPVVYYHGLDEADSAPQVIGEELGWERRED